MSWLWWYAASSAASVIFGVLAFFVLQGTGYHRDINDKVAGSKIALCILQSIAFYTVAVCILGQWLVHIPVSETIHKGFGDERAAWLLLGVAIDVGVRLYSLFDPE
jgi:hypothetical protein